MDNAMAKAKNKTKKTKGQTMIYKTLHRKLKIEKHEHLKNQRLNSGALER
jgi:hypothetical protein